MTDKGIRHKNIIVRGSVQGVGYRYACKKMAYSLGVRGFVRNLYDGGVYIEAEGTETQLEHFIHWCTEGPSHAHVTDLDITEGEVKYFKHFDVVH